MLQADADRLHSLRGCRQHQTPPSCMRHAACHLCSSAFTGQLFGGCSLLVDSSVVEWLLGSDPAQQQGGKRRVVYLLCSEQTFSYVLDMLESTSQSLEESG
jgi:hypothetical protein